MVVIKKFIGATCTPTAKAKHEYLSHCPLCSSYNKGHHSLRNQATPVHPSISIITQVYTGFRPWYHRLTDCIRQHYHCFRHKYRNMNSIHYWAPFAKAFNHNIDLGKYLTFQDVSYYISTIVSDIVHYISTLGYASVLFQYDRNI